MESEGLIARAYGRWPEIMRELAPNPYLLDAIDRYQRYSKRAKWATHCPLHGGNSGKAFHVYPNFAETGWSVCNSCFSISGYEMLMRVNGWSVTRAGLALGGYLDGNRYSAPRVIVPAPAPPPVERPDPPPWSSEDIAEWWTQAVLLDDPLAEPARLFFAPRGLGAVPVLPTLKVHPALQWTKKLSQRFPALLAKFVDAHGRGVGLQRLFLTAQGAKAPIFDPRMSIKIPGETLAGSVVQLFSPGPVLGIAEGIETALAVYLATGMPMWAATSTSLMRSVYIPNCVRRVVIWADYDELSVVPKGRPLDQGGRLIDPGREAAEYLAARLRAEYRDVTIVPADVLGRRGVDWNDVLVEVGEAEFRQLLLRGRVGNWLHRFVLQNLVNSRESQSVV